MFSQSVHDKFSANNTNHFNHDLDARRLQKADIAKYIFLYERIRIYADYSQITVGGPSEINTIKRITNITASYFYNILKVSRLERLYFPDTNRSEPKCNILTVPRSHVAEGRVGDLKVLASNEENIEAIYVAKSSACAFLQSTKRTIWGMMQFNIA